MGISYSCCGDENQAESNAPANIQLKNSSGKKKTSSHMLINPDELQIQKRIQAKADQELEVPLFISDPISSSIVEEDNTDETEMREEFGAYTDGKDLPLNLDLIRPLKLEHEFNKAYNNDIEGDQPITVGSVLGIIDQFETEVVDAPVEGEEKPTLVWSKDTSKSLKAYSQLTVAKCKAGSPIYQGVPLTKACFTFDPTLNLADILMNMLDHRTRLTWDRNISTLKNIRQIDPNIRINFLKSQKIMGIEGKQFIDKQIMFIHPSEAKFITYTSYLDPEIVKIQPGIYDQIYSDSNPPKAKLPKTIVSVNIYESGQYEDREDLGTWKEIRQTSYSQMQLNLNRAVTGLVNMYFTSQLMSWFKNLERQLESIKDLEDSELIN